MVTHSPRSSVGSDRRRSKIRRLGALLLPWLLVAFAAGQSRPGWVVQDGVASVEPFAAPARIVASDASLVVACDADAPDGLNVAMFVGSYDVPLPERLDVLVRIDRQPPRRAEWITNQDTLALPAYFDEVTNVLDDLRSGATFAARLFLFGGVEDAAQPTFQFDVSGFTEVERRLGCGAAGAAGGDPFADAPASPAPPAPPPPPAPPAPGRSATPGGALPVTPWSVAGSGRDTTAVATGGDASLLATCEYESQLPIALVLLDGGPAAGRAFSLRFEGGDVLDLVDLGEGLFQIVPAGVPALGGTGLLIAAAAADGFDVRAVFADGSEVTLLRAAGGDGFFAAWDALPCTGASDPSGEAGAAAGWRLELDGGAVSYRDARGRGMGFLCSETDDGPQPVIYLELPGVPVTANGAGLADFVVARANGTAGPDTWTFADAGDGFYLTDLVATDDIGLKLLPDPGSDVWNTVTFALPGGSGPVLTVPGASRVAELFGQLSCVR
jgi:hypothetical protein